MREIKFRAWFNNIIIDTMSIQEMIHQKVNNIPIKNLNNEVIFLQYTGLKDIKGVEIYEGDIVYLSGKGLTEIEFPFIELYQACYENDIGVIVGNIYENPELLQGDKNA